MIATRPLISPMLALSLRSQRVRAECTGRLGPLTPPGEGGTTRLPPGTGGGGRTTRSLSAPDDGIYPEDQPPERVIPIGGRRRDPARQRAGSGPEYDESEPQPRRAR